MSETIPVEYQGQGSYEYRCKSPDCWYCEMMGLEKASSVLTERTYKSYNIKKLPQLHNMWTKKETDNLIEMIDAKPRDLIKYFPGRSIKSLYYKQHILRKNRIDNY